MCPHSMFIVIKKTKFKEKLLNQLLKHLLKITIYPIYKNVELNYNLYWKNMEKILKEHSTLYLIMVKYKLLNYLV